MEATLPKQMQSEREGDYELFRDVPVFDEHVGDDGVPYDKRRLQCICDNNNHRINDTGDFCPLVVGHTPGESGGEQPPVVGFAGPFKVSVIGNVDPRACIFADFRVHQDHAETFRNNPRRSVELWPEEDPDDRFFDPIAILGAETPKRALGITRYRASTRTKQPIRYEMGADSGTSEGGGHNTFIPGMGTKKKKKPQSYSEREENMDAITPEIILQVVEAAMPQITSAIAEQVGALTENDALAQASPDPSIDPMAAEGMPVAGEIPPVAPLTPAAEEPTADPIAPMIDKGAEIDKEPSDMYKHAKSKLAKYMQADESEHKTGAMDYAMDYAKGLDDDDRAEFDSVLDGGDTDEDKAFYGKLKCAMSGGQEDQMSGGAKVQYAKAQTRIRAQDARIAELETSKRATDQAIRHSKRSHELDALSQDYVINDGELEHCKDMTDAQFESHVERIPQNYQKVNGPDVARRAVAPDRAPDTKADKYSAIAVAGAQKYNKATGKHMTFDTAFKIAKEGGSFVETVATP
jgi:hypothetical protein